MNDADWRERLQQAAARREQWRGLAAEVRNVERQLLQHHAAAVLWQRQAERAGEELQRLEGWGVAGILRRLVGRGETRRAAAQADIAEARQQHEAVDAVLAPLLQQQAALAAQHPALGDAEAAFRDVLQAKEAWLRERGGDAVGALDASRSRLDAAEALLHEVTLALELARSAESALRHAMDELWNARKRTTWRGSSLLALGARWTGSRQAAAAIDRANQQMARLTESLARLRGRGLSGSDDVLAAASLASLHVGADLQQEPSEVQEVLEQVREVTWELERRAAAAQQVRDACDAERMAWIEQA